MQHRYNAFFTSCVLVLCGVGLHIYFRDILPELTFDRIILSSILVHVMYLRLLKQDELENV
jgi:hypothetical protein